VSSNSPRRCILVGIAGSADTYSLSLFNLKAYALNVPAIRDSWDIQVLQCGLVSPPFEDRMVPALASRICESHPDLVGFSCYVWNVRTFQRLASEVRSRLPNSTLLWGGPEMAVDYLRAGRFDSYTMDYCISGEGEKTFAELLSYMSAGSPSPRNILGLSYRDQSGTAFLINGPRAAFSSLMEIPSPFLTGTVDDEVLQRPGLEANIETQRGCSLRCSYCVYHKDMKTISYSIVDRVNSEIAFLQRKGVRRLRFDDANFTSDLPFAKEIIRRCIAENFTMSLMFELVPGFIDEEFCQLLEDYQQIDENNRVCVGIGVQTINLTVLKRIRRGIRLEVFENTFSVLQRHKIYTKIDIIIGLPGESVDSIERTMEYMLNRLKHSEDHLLCFHLMRELPGTELRDIAKEYAMRFASAEEGHELIESPMLPRSDLIQLLRVTAVIFRLTNQLGWTNREFLSGKQSADISVRELFFETRTKLEVSSVSLVRLLVDALMSHLEPRNSRFVQPDFPLAEAWWWNNSRFEVSNEWIKQTLVRLARDAPGRKFTGAEIFEN
jgi:radical SAM superfamily enzyme YgiQ (UPF0313 family)